MITATGVTRRYGAHIALDHVDLHVPAGSVYGLVGPNGAGKTTLLSILAGLRRKDEGTVTIDAPPERRAVLPDAPRFEPWLTGREVVALAARMTGGEDAVDRSLDDAGLADSADRTVGGYSRGMLQRLGLAATLVSAPQVVLLDEPAAALDPAGRRQVLDLLERMRGEATVVFSSHILADVQAVCDRVGILGEGRLVFEGAVEDLVGGAAAAAYVLRVRSGADAVAGALGTEPWVTAVERLSGSTLRVTVTDLGAAERSMMRALGSVDAAVISVEPETPSLEQVFLELTG